MGTHNVSRSPFRFFRRVTFEGNGTHNVQTLAGNRTLAQTDAQFQILNPNGSSRTVTLPAEETNQGAWFEIRNSGATAGQLLNVNNDAASLVKALDIGESARFICDGATWTYTLDTSGVAASTLAIADSVAPANFYTSDTVQGAVDELKAALGGTNSTTRNYSSNRAVADNDDIVVAIGKMDAFAAQTGVNSDSAPAGVTVGDHGAITPAGSVDSTPLEVMRTGTVTTPAAANSAGVHAAYNDNAANAFPGPITQPDVPRTLTYTTAGAGWTGGDVTATGTDQFDQAQSETVTPNAGGGTVLGTNIFKTVTSITKAAAGAATTTLSVGTGDTLGVPHTMTKAIGTLAIAGTPEAAQKWDAVNMAFLPTNLANGARTYDYVIPVSQGHVHTVTAITVTPPAHVVGDAGHVHQQN